MGQTLEISNPEIRNRKLDGLNNGPSNLRFRISGFEISRICPMSNAPLSNPMSAFPSGLLQ